MAQITDSLKFLLSDPILATEKMFISQPKHIKGFTYSIFCYASDMWNTTVSTYTTTFISLHPIHTHTQILKEVRVAQPAYKSVQICLSHMLLLPGTCHLFLLFQPTSSPLPTPRICFLLIAPPSPLYRPQPLSAFPASPCSFFCAILFLYPTSLLPPITSLLRFSGSCTEETRDKSSHSLSCDLSLPVATTGCSHRYVTILIVAVSNLRQVSIALY